MIYTVQKHNQKKHKLHKITAHTVQNNGTQKCTQKQTCIIPNRINTHKNTAKYNIQQFTSYRAKHNNLDTLNAKIDGQRGMYGQDIAYAKCKPHQEVIVNAKKIKYKGRLYRKTRIT